MYVVSRVLMENQADAAAFPPRSGNRMALFNSYHATSLHGGGNAYHPKLGSKCLDEDGEDEAEEGDECEEEEEDEVDEEYDEEEDEPCVEPDPPRRQHNSFPCPLGGPSRTTGVNAALPVLGNSISRAAVKVVEQEKHYRDDWNEAATMALLQVWGTKYLQLGRKSLKLDDWADVAQQVTHLGKSLKTDIQCRNRIDTLKKKYKREKQKQVTIGSSSCKWVYFRQMDALLNPFSQRSGLPCAVDAGHIVRMKPNLWKNKNEGKNDTHAAFKSASSSGEFKDSPKVSQSSFNISDEGEHTKKNQTSKKRKSKDAPFRSIAKAIKRFGEIYEKMESAKQQQLLDLERTRMEFTRELELQKMQLLIKTQLELAKLKQSNNGMDASVSNISG
eukprot:c24995_g1_i1 orf=929-2092(-)